MTRSSSFTPPAISRTSRFPSPVARWLFPLRKRSSVNQVVFNGNRKIKDDKLAAVVKTHAARTLQSRRRSSPTSQAIKDAYAATGRSEVQVTTQVVPLGEGRVNLAFVIDEGDRTKIGRHQFRWQQRL